MIGRWLTTRVERREGERNRGWDGRGRERGEEGGGGGDQGGGGVSLYVKRINKEVGFGS